MSNRKTDSRHHQIKAKSTYTKVEVTKYRRIKRLLFTGFSMGLADLVPGVSGGTIAFLFGIYDELLYSIKQATGVVPRHMLERKFKEAWRALPIGFLLPLFIGIGAAIFGLSNLVTYLLNNYPVFIWSLFFGLVIGSTFVISKRITRWNLKRIALLMCGVVFTYLIIGSSFAVTNSSPVTLFITGMIAFCAMILPGISGSLIMVVLGQYEKVITAVSKFDLSTLIYVALGGIVGLALFSRLLSWLLKNYHGATIALLVGMMIGSLRKVWPWQESGNMVAPNLDYVLVIAIVLMVLGFLLVIGLEKIGLATEHNEDIDDKEFKKEVASLHNK